MTTIKRLEERILYLELETNLALNKVKGGNTNKVK